eukprot:gene3079-3358_t
MHRDEALYAGSSAVSAAIARAASGAMTAKTATRIGDDVGHIITHPMTPFAIDHDPAMKGERKLQEHDDDPKSRLATVSVRDAIADAADGSVPAATATSIGSFWTNAATHGSVSDDAMIAMAAGQGTRRLSAVSSEGMHRDEALYAGSSAVSAAIARAASGAMTAKTATRIGDDVGHIITHPMTPFAIDHDPAMKGERKLQEHDDGDSVQMASIHTSEAIATMGAEAAPVGAVHASAAGFHGSGYIGDMQDSMVHRQAADRPNAPRKLLAV